MQNFQEKGFTLLELLASIVLIGVIFTSLFHFLGQNIFMSASVEDQYVTAQLAEREMEEIKLEEELDVPDVAGEKTTYEYDLMNNNKIYKVTAEIYAEDSDEAAAGLYRLRVNVAEEESDRSSVAYGWYMMAGDEGDGNE